MEKNYSHLQMQINDLIKKTGSVENAINFLSSVMPNSTNREDLSLFITFSVSNHFGCTVSELINEDGNKNAGYRMVCYQLHKEFAEMSIRKTAVVYKRKENAVFKGLQRMDEIKDDPSLDIKIYECYICVKNQIQKSIEYLNGKG